jgi:hypothetical protein
MCGSTEGLHCVSSGRQIHNAGVLVASQAGECLTTTLLRFLAISDRTSNSADAWSASRRGCQPRSAVARLPEVLPDAVMVQSAECLFDPTLLVTLPGIGQDAAYPYRQEILAPTAILVADGGDRIIRCGDLH